MTTAFYASISLYPCQLDLAGVPQHRHPEAVEAVRQAVEAMPEARWVSVTYRRQAPPGWSFMTTADLLDRSVSVAAYWDARPPVGAEWTALKRSIGITVENILRLVALGMLGPVVADET